MERVRNALAHLAHHQRVKDSAEKLGTPDFNTYCLMQTVLINTLVHGVLISVVRQILYTLLWLKVVYSLCDLLTEVMKHNGKEELGGGEDVNKCVK